jgi:DNA-binding transcriptional LysR family regulator
MDDKKLYALLEAVRSGSLSKAASELGYTQSGLTQMMNSLEDELGCCLLVRRLQRHKAHARRRAAAALY